MNHLVDQDGFLVNYKDWNKFLAVDLAKRQGIKLSFEHLEIVTLVRQFYNEFKYTPSQRPLVKYIEINLGKEKGNGIYLAKLFPGSSAKIVALISGLPKPPSCF